MTYLSCFLSPFVSAFDSATTFDTQKEEEKTKGVQSNIGKSETRRVIKSYVKRKRLCNYVPFLRFYTTKKEKNKICYQMDPRISNLLSDGPAIRWNCGFFFSLDNIFEMMIYLFCILCKRELPKRKKKHWKKKQKVGSHIVATVRSCAKIHQVYIRIQQGEDGLSVHHAWRWIKWCHRHVFFPTAAFVVVIACFGCKHLGKVESILFEHTNHHRCLVTVGVDVRGDI